MFYKILIAEVTCQGDEKMSYNVPSISEVATEGSNLGEATNGSETRYALLYAVGEETLEASGKFFLVPSHLCTLDTI